jgi:hypothetical protein
MTLIKLQKSLKMISYHPESSGHSSEETEKFRLCMCGLRIIICMLFTAHSVCAPRYPPASDKRLENREGGSKLHEDPAPLVLDRPTAGAGEACDDPQSCSYT